MLSGYNIYEVILFFVIVIVSLLIDLKAHGKDEKISAKNAALWSLFWIGLAFLFSGYLWKSHGGTDASLFITGYILEKSLSVDNLFVIMAIFSSFAIKDEFQHRVLYYGILGAIIFRFLFIAAGSSLIMIGGKYVLGLFGVFVLWTAVKMWQNSGGDSEEIADYSNHFSVRFTRKIFSVSTHLDGHNFFTKQSGKLFVTPLFLCLICVEIADIMFAFDSVPAVIAVTQKPFLVYTSNIFAILGLRSLYFLLSAAKRYLRNLEKSVIAILFFIGFKMLLEVVKEFNLIEALNNIHISPQMSLAIVGTLLLVGILSSLIPEKKLEK